MAMKRAHIKRVCGILTHDKSGPRPPEQGKPMASKKPRTSAKESIEADDQEPEKPKPAVKLTRTTMVDLYAARQVLPLSVQKETGLRMPVEVFFKDPAVAKSV